MVGLEKWQPDPNLRYKHIVENMIYTCELQAKNVFLWLCAVDPHDEYETNTYWGSFLDEGFDKHMKDIWGLDKFDMVLGNPPYQVADATGDNKLYLDFSKKSIKNLKTNGMLLFITPKNIIDYFLICEKNRTYFDKFYQVEHLAIDTPAKYFKGVGSTFVYFLISKVDYHKETNLIYLDSSGNEKSSSFLLEGGKSIPNILSKLDLSIISKIRKSNNLFDFKKMKTRNLKEFRIRKKQFDDGLVSELKTEIYPYPVIDGINKSNTFPGKVFYMKNDYSDNKTKIVFNGSGYLMPSYDERGNYFLSDNISYIEISSKSEYDSFMSLFNSKIFKYWLNQFRMNGFSDSKNIKNFPKVDLSMKWTDKDLYEYFNLTEEEINLIETTIK